MSQPIEHPDVLQRATWLQSVVLDPGYRLTFVLNADGTIREVSEVVGVQYFQESFCVGLRIEELAGGAASWPERIRRARTERAPVRYLDQRPGQQSGPPTVEVTVTPVRAADGGLQAIIVNSREAAPELGRVQLQEQLRTALAISQMGCFAVSFADRLMDGDERLMEILGIDPAQLMSNSGIDGFFAMIHSEDRKYVEQLFARALTGDRDYDVEYRFWRDSPDGPVLRWCAVRGRVEVDGNGPVRMVGVVSDITDRRQDDDARMRLQKREALDTVVGGIAHDFSNVISAILSNAAVAELELKAGHSPATSVEEIGRGARRARDLVQRMVAFSHEGEPMRELFDLAAVVGEVCSLLRPTLRPQVRLNLDVQHPLPRLLGDSGQLHQVLMNLVTNAAQAIAEEVGVIDILVDELRVTEPLEEPVGCVPPGDYLRIQVSDDGPGLPDKVIGRIFDPYFTTKPHGQGTGLGLAVTQMIVRGHGGYLTVDSELGEGTRFTVFLPAAHLVTESEVAPPGAPSPPPVAEDADPDVGHARVLFVDDEEALARLAERAMPRGCSAVGLSDPLAALERFAATPERFDVLVTDLSMPGLSGLELIDRVRGIRPELPVVLSSGYLSEEARRQATLAHVDAIVDKPCSIDDLAAAAVKVVDERRAAAKAGRSQR